MIRDGRGKENRTGFSRERDGEWDGTGQDGKERDQMGRDGTGHTGEKRTGRDRAQGDIT